MEIRSATFFWRGRVPRLRSMGLARLSEERLGVGLLATETSCLALGYQLQQIGNVKLLEFV